MDMELRRVEISDLPSIYCRVVDDFVPGEYAPRGRMEEMIRQGIVEGYVFSKDGQDCGYVFCHSDPGGRFMLVGLLAVYQESRGQGLGGELLECLKRRFSGLEGIFLEVEKPEFAETAKDGELRRRRIGFYQRCGFLQAKSLPRYVLWDIPYYVLFCPLTVSGEELDQKAPEYLYELYRTVLGTGNLSRLILDSGE